MKYNNNALDSRLSDLNQLQDKNKETINKLTNYTHTVDSRNLQLEKNVKDLNMEIDFLINECLETDSDSDAYKNFFITMKFCYV